MRRVAALVVLLAFAPTARAADDPAKVFEERILPIFKSPDPSSCVRCHLAAVDLKNYILPSAKDTFLALREQGLIDLDKPENSKILALVNQSGEVFLSGTKIRGSQVIRLSIGNLRTKERHVRRTLDLLEETAKDL